MMSEITDGIYTKIQPVLDDILSSRGSEKWEISKILDVGCGSGRSTIMMEDIFPEINILGNNDHMTVIIAQELYFCIYR